MNIFVHLVILFLIENVFTLQKIVSLAEETISNEKRLTKSLIDKYASIGRNGRPVTKENETTRVEFGLQLIQIMGLDERTQILTTNVWCKYKWTDKYLAWNETDFGGVQIVRIPIENIWKPDFVLYNYAGDRYTEQSDAMAVVTSTGDVTWVPPARLKSTCEIDATRFPFDEQTCSMKFGSWVYGGKALDPFFNEGKEDIGLDDYVTSNEWAITNHSAKKNFQIYECCPNEPYPDLTFRLTLKRKDTFYRYILIMPYFLLMAITLLTFLLPPESSSKTTLGFGIFGGYFLLLLLLQNATPPASEHVPIIGACYCFHLVITAAATFLCGIVSNLHFSAERRNPPPDWLKRAFIEVGAPILWIDVPRNRGSPSTSLQGDDSSARQPAGTESVKLLTTANDGDGAAGGGQLLPSDREIREIKKALQQYAKKAQSKERKQQGVVEWRIISSVLDRFLFLLYTVCIVVSVAAFPLYNIGI